MQSLTARGTPLTPRTPPHSLWQVPVATPGLRGVRLSSWSHPEPSFPRTAASPVRSDCFAPVGVQVIHEPAAPVRLCRTASGAVQRCLPHQVQLPALLCRCLLGPSSPAPCCTPVGDDIGSWLDSVLVHDPKTCCTSLAKLARAGPYHGLNGTVALFRIRKHILIVYHHFCHGGAPRCGHGRHPALFRRCC